MRDIRCAAILRPVNMASACAVTGFAPDAHLGKGGFEAVLRGIVVLVHVGGVALRAHVVPVLLRPGPVERIRRRNVFLGIQMKPPLPAFGLGPRIPGIGQRLQPPIREFDEILLEGIDPERIFDGELGFLPVLALRGDKEAPILAGEARLGAEMRGLGAVEVAQHGRFGRLLHRMGMLRRLPGFCFFFVASGANRRTGIVCGLCRAVLCRQSGCNDLASEDQAA